MNQTTSRALKRNKKPLFAVGDVVQFPYVRGKLQGRIVEDRGALGRGGTHLYRIVVEDESVDREIELPSDELEKVASG